MVPHPSHRLHVPVVRLCTAAPSVPASMCARGDSVCVASGPSVDTWDPKKKCQRLELEKSIITPCRQSSHPYSRHLARTHALPLAVWQSYPSARLLIEPPARPSARPSARWGVATSATP